LGLALGIFVKLEGCSQFSHVFRKGLKNTVITGQRCKKYHLIFRVWRVVLQGPGKFLFRKIVMSCPGIARCQVKTCIGVIGVGIYGCLILGNGLIEIAEAKIDISQCKVGIGVLGLHAEEFFNTFPGKGEVIHAKIRESHGIVRIYEVWIDFERFLECNQRFVEFVDPGQRNAKVHIAIAVFGVEPDRLVELPDGFRILLD